MSYHEWSNLAWGIRISTGDDFAACRCYSYYQMVLITSKRLLEASDANAEIKRSVVVKCCADPSVRGGKCYNCGKWIDDA